MRESRSSCAPRSTCATGQGLAKLLIKAALDETRDEGLGVFLPFCPFVHRYVSKNRNIGAGPGMGTRTLAISVAQYSDGSAASARCTAVMAWVIST